MTEIVQELTDQLAYLSDPEVVWVPACPDDGQSCLVVSIPTGDVDCVYAFSNPTVQFLTRFLTEYDRSDYDLNELIDPVEWNDHYAKSRDEVLWMLEEAIDLAEALGV
jgi:hypothetical protein